MNDITGFRTMVVRKNKTAKKNMLKEKISAENHSFSEKKWLTLQNPDSIYEETKINYKTKHDY